MPSPSDAEHPYYSYTGPVECIQEFDTSSIKGKTAIVTGGAKGIGGAYTKALVKAGAFVVIGDVDSTAGTSLENEFSSSIKFVKCDVREWSDQVTLFRTATGASPTKHIDIVIANAGVVTRRDELFYHDLSLEEPNKPDLNVLDVNLTGQIYTTKLALHHFHRQRVLNGETQPDYNLVFTASMAAYTGLLPTLQYCTSKYALRGFYNGLRLCETPHGIRVNMICPSYIKTDIGTPQHYEALEKQGIKFAKLDDVALCLTRILSDKTVIGRAFGVWPREWFSTGYTDLDLDNFKADDEFLGSWQDMLYRMVGRPWPRFGEEGTKQ